MSNKLLAYNELTSRQIPLEVPSVAGWKEVPLTENGEHLVPLGMWSDNNDIFTDSIYFGERTDSPYPDDSLKGNLITMFVREGVAEQLKKAHGLLPRGMYLVVFDTYRTLEVQQSLYDTYFNALKEQHSDWSDEDLSKETQKYVSIPSHDPTRPSPHNTGGSVDLAIFKLPDDIDRKVREISEELAKTPESNWQHAYRLEMRRNALVKEHAELLNFGTRFDYGGGEAALNYYERLAKEHPLKEEEQEAMKNRRLLYNIMIDAGFEAYEDEWWHFNSKKSQMGAKTAGLDHAEYGAAVLSPESLKHEEMRKGHRLGSIRMLQGATLRGKVNPLQEHFEVAKAAVDETGDIRITSLPEAAVIKPPK